MANIKSFSCYSCGKNPSDGVSVFRMNETGVKGVWGCGTHSQLIDNDALRTMVAELEACRDMALTPHQAGELLGVKVVE